MAMATINQRQLRLARRELFRGLGAEIRRIRDDAGRSQAAISRTSSVSQGHISTIEAGTAEPSIEALMAIAEALGCDLSVRFWPRSGPRIRDRLQVAITEALLELLHPRWVAQPEVPVYRPIRGVIDIVLADADAHEVVASEVQSQLRRIEQQIRWSVQKADALVALPEFSGERVGRLLVVRNTAAMRETIRAAGRTLAASYPARSAEAFASLTGTTPWPGAALIWANVEVRRVRILDGPPRGIVVGR
jgi:transcriptional regulator with XRE-family HTH domain